MAITVLRELRKEMSADLGPGQTVSHIKAVHAAPAAPDTGGVGDRTFCGEPTQDMERVDHRPSEPGAPWLPPGMTPWECSDCADALRST